MAWNFEMLYGRVDIRQEFRVDLALILIGSMMNNRERMLVSLGAAITCVIRSLKCWRFLTCMSILVVELGQSAVDLSRELDIFIRTGC